LGRLKPIGSAVLYRRFLLFLRFLALTRRWASRLSSRGNPKRRLTKGARKNLKDQGFSSSPSDGLPPPLLKFYTEIPHTNTCLSPDRCCDSKRMVFFKSCQALLPCGLLAPKFLCGTDKLVFKVSLWLEVPPDLHFLPPPEDNKTLKIDLI